MFVSYNWDIFYFMWSSKSESLVKIQYVKEQLFGTGDVLYPLLFAFLLMFIPALVNTFRHWFIDNLDNYRLKHKSELELSRAQIDLQIAEAKAERAFAVQRVELEVKDNIRGILQEAEALSAEVGQKNQHIEQLSEFIEDLKSNLKLQESQRETFEHKAREEYAKLHTKLEEKLEHEIEIQKSIYNTLLAVLNSENKHNVPTFETLKKNLSLTTSFSQSNQIGTEISMPFSHAKSVSNN
ncbi:hypothetical protein [Shewanella chilikensis]|uniref:hypothetical protein n=1 Tax=Shewanella chilikensis TaxID=558541 RepID=UPI00399A343C